MKTVFVLFLISSSFAITYQFVFPISSILIVINNCNNSLLTPPIPPPKACKYQRNNVNYFLFKTSWSTICRVPTVVKAFTNGTENVVVSVFKTQFKHFKRKKTVDPTAK